MNVAWVAGLSIRRFLRDRTAMFFVVVLPVVVIVVIGATVGGFGSFRVAVVDQDAHRSSVDVARALGRSRALSVRRFDTVDAARTSVRRSETILAVVIPAGTSRRLESGRRAPVRVLGDPTTSNYQAAAAAVGSALAGQGARVQAAAFAAQQLGGGVTDHLAQVDAAAAVTHPIAVRARDIDTVRRVLPEGFSYSAPTMLVLFVFINALAAGAGIIESRRLGMYERMSAAPIRGSSIVLGETLAYLSIALAQSLLIVVVGAVGFGVSWGDPLAAGVLIVGWALVGTGAGVLSGTLFRTPEQASSIGPALGIAFGMLGGCMWPLEIVAPLMRTLGHLAPHAWAVDAWTILLSRGGGLADIGRDLAVLAAFAAVLLASATFRLRRRLV